MSELSEHAKRNRAEWDRWADDYFELGRRAWASNEPSWGMWGIPESQPGVLPDVAGKDALELGCGTAYWSAWLARRGARVVGTRQVAEAARERAPVPAGVAARVLRAEGVLWSLRNSTLLMLGTPPSGEGATERLERPQFGLHRLEWPDEPLGNVTPDWAGRWPSEEIWKARKWP